MRKPRLRFRCRCGCGILVATPGRLWAPGHNARYQIRTMESNLKRSGTLKGHPDWTTKDGIARMRRSIVDKFASDPGYRIRVSESMMEFRRSNPGYYEYQRAEASRSSRELWSDPRWRERQTRLIAVGVGSNSFFSGLERDLSDIIESFSLPFRHNDRLLTIGGKYPDFYALDKPLLVEVFGNYWHNGEDEEFRRGFFSAHGYKTLVIWESYMECFSAEEIAQALDRWYVNPDLSSSELFSLDKRAEAIHLAPSYELG